MVDAKRRRADDEDEAAEREATRAAKKAASKSPASTFAFTDDRHSLLEFATELDEEHNISLNELVSVFSGLGRNVDGTTTSAEIEALSAGRRWHAAMHASRHLKRLLPHLARFMPARPTASAAPASAAPAAPDGALETASGTGSQSGDSDSASDEQRGSKLTERALERQNLRGMQQGKSTISFSIFCQAMLFAARDAGSSAGDGASSD